jgi:hypothetical protein
VPAGTLGPWAWKLRRESAALAPQASDAAFVELVASESVTSAADGRIEIVLPGERRVLVSGAVNVATRHGCCKPMLSLPASVRVFAPRQRVDFRKGFDGLGAIVRDGYGLLRGLCARASVHGTACQAVGSYLGEDHGTGGRSVPGATQAAGVSAATLSAVTRECTAAPRAELVTIAKDANVAAARESCDRTLGKPVAADLIERLESLEARARSRASSW